MTLSLSYVMTTLPVAVSVRPCAVCVVTTLLCLLNRTAIVRAEPSSTSSPAAEMLVTEPLFRAPGQPFPVDGIRPVTMPGRLRSWRAPVAVHGAPGIRIETLFAVHDAAVRALDVFQRTYGLPLPAPDGVRGGGPELDLYVVPDGPAVDTVIDALEYGAPWDSASAFVTVRGDLSGDALVRATAEGIAQAILLGIDAHAPRPWRLALAAWLAARAMELGPDLQAMARFQRDPGAALLAHRDDASARGAAMLIDFLVARYDGPGLPLIKGLIWMPVVRTPVDSPRFADEPDVFDVMERLFQNERGGLDGVLVEFAVARALTGTLGDTIPLAPWLDDPALLPDTIRTVHYEQLPAWVTPPRMLDETGTAYVVIDTARAGDRGLNLWFHGVPWRRWAVTVVRLDAEGREAGRVPASPVIRGEWSTTMVSLLNTPRVLVVINDLGNGHYDPDEPPDRNGFFALNIGRNE